MRFLSRLFARRARPAPAASYIDVDTTVAAARDAGLSITAYREREAFEATGDERFLGRRDRVYTRLARSLEGREIDTILEIGPGAGAFTEVFVRDHPRAEYQIYEVRDDWRTWLGGQFPVRPMSCDGKTLTPTPDGSVDVVHAHATFVYIPPLVTLGYLLEAARVLRAGGVLAFDVYTEKDLTHAVALETIRGEHQFHTIIPESLLMDFVPASRFAVLDTFCEQHTLTTDSRYFVLEKRTP